MLTKISKKNIVKLKKFITNPVIGSELVLTKKKSIKCTEGTCKDCIFSSSRKDIEPELDLILRKENIACHETKCINLANNYILVEK